MITVKFFNKRTNQPATIAVDTDDYGKAFLAAVEAGGDPFRKMLYKVVEGQR